MFSSSPVFSGAVTPTTITISGSVPSSSAVTGFMVEWQRDTSFGCSDVNQDTMSVTGPFTSYTITGLEPGNNYLITVRMYNAFGSAPATLSAMTETIGEGEGGREGGRDRYLAAISSTAPTGYPRSIRSGTVTPHSITVHWEEVDCLDRNGAITGYVARALSNGREEGTASVDGDDREATISGLTPSTQYIVQVAAVNSAGTGPYSLIALYGTEGSA